jgi:hypothetical protein
MDTEIVETRKIAYETWRFQVDSYWTRNSYFAAFEIAAVAGVWKVADSHPWMGAVFSVLCMVLTLIWLFSNHRVHEYIELWWKKAAQLDPASFELANGFSEFREEERKQKSRCLERVLPVPYAIAIQGIPILFLLGWIALASYAVRGYFAFTVSASPAKYILNVGNIFDPILALAALVTAVFAVVQAQAARANAEAAKASAEGSLNSERGWVLVERIGNPESWYVPDNPAYAPGMVFQFRVYGNTPAKVMEARFQLVAVPAKDKDEPFNLDLPPIPDYAGMKPMRDIPELGIVLPPGKTFELRLGLEPPTLTEPQWFDLRDGKTIITAFGVVKYEDAFGRAKETRVCYAYDFAWGGVITAPDGTRLNSPGFRPSGPPQYNKTT